MSKPLRIDSDAEEELKAAARWYEQQRSGLGYEFVAAIDDALRETQEQPAAMSLYPGIAEDLGVRRRLVARFPYAIAYIERDTHIDVLAFAHGRRRPGYWKDRLQGS